MSSTGDRSWVIASSSGRFSRNASLKICASRCFDRRSFALGQPGVQHLPRIVPLVKRRHRVEPFVALQPDQPRVECLGQHLGALRLADAGRTFDQKWLVEREGELQRGRERFVDDEPAIAEAFTDARLRRSRLRPELFRSLHEMRPAHRAAEIVRLPADLRRVPCAGDFHRHPAYRVDGDCIGALDREPASQQSSSVSAGGWTRTPLDASAQFRQGSTERPRPVCGHRDRALPDCGSCPRRQSFSPSSTAQTVAARLRDATRPTYGWRHRESVRAPPRRSALATPRPPPARWPRDAPSAASSPSVSRATTGCRAMPLPRRCRAARANRRRESPRNPCCGRCAPATPATGVAPTTTAVAPARTARCRRPRRPPIRTSSGSMTCSGDSSEAAWRQDESTRARLA